jgi:hypothetical protein
MSCPRASTASDTTIPSPVLPKTIAAARELLLASQPEDLPDDQDVAATAKPCPCCGGRMIVIEIFRAGSQPSMHRPPASTHHDGRFIRPLYYPLAALVIAQLRSRSPQALLDKANTASRTCQPSQPTQSMAHDRVDHHCIAKRITARQIPIAPRQPR